MGKSSKVTRLGNFQSHKKAVRQRSLVKEKRPKKVAYAPAAKAAAPVAPVEAKRDEPKKK